MQPHLKQYSPQQLHKTHHGQSTTDYEYAEFANTGGRRLRRGTGRTRSLLCTHRQEGEERSRDGHMLQRDIFSALSQEEKS